MRLSSRSWRDWSAKLLVAEAATTDAFMLSIGVPVPNPVVDIRVVTVAALAPPVKFLVTRIARTRPRPGIMTAAAVTPKVTNTHSALGIQFGLTQLQCSDARCTEAGTKSGRDAICGQIVWRQPQVGGGSALIGCNAHGECGECMGKTTLAVALQD